MKSHPFLTAFLFLIVATTLETCGDALIRKSMHEYTGTYRIVATIVGALLLFGYGIMLNLAPLEFSKVVGLYIATLFIVWQITSYFTFGSVPSLAVVVGGLMIIIGGLIVAYAKF